MVKVVAVLLNFLYFAVHYTAVLAEWNTNDYMKREHSLIKPYNDGRWDMVGSAIITNNYVRLTPDHQSRRGSIWNSQPVRIPEWELHVHFKVHGKGSSDLFGDGMAIWYVRDRLRSGPVFGAKDYFHGLSIFLDTYNNHNGPHNHGHPYISAMVNNGTFGYDHDRDGTHTELAGCESQFRKAQHDTYVAIRYERHKLTVSTDTDGKNAWKECFTVNGIRLPTGYYLGASGITGDLADNHDIISMKLYDISIDRQKPDEDTDNIQPSAEQFAPPRERIEDEKRSFFSSKVTGWRLFIMIFLILIGVGVCAMVGYIVFSKRQEDARKRFY